MPGTEPATLSSLGGMQLASSSLCNGNCSAAGPINCTWGSNRFHFQLTIRARTVYSRPLSFWLKMQFFVVGLSVVANFSRRHRRVPVGFHLTAAASQTSLGRRRLPPPQPKQPLSTQ